MSAHAAIGGQPNYFVAVFTSVGRSLAQLVRPPSHSRRAEAARRSARHVLWLVAVLGAAIIVLMVALDAAEIGLMPPRGTASLWPVRILTDLGKSAYVLWSLAGLMFVVALVSPRVRGNSRFLLFGLATRLQFLFLAVLMPVLAGELIKWIVGRGRPFVGGHAITSFALAFAVSAIWPQARAAMLAYAIMICATRLVLLAHHPSDVVAGALIGIIGAMFVRYWFAARRLGFAICLDGTIVPLAGPSLGHLKRVARDAFAP
jgi:undecaprenyl-diphosphatase